VRLQDLNLYNIGNTIQITGIIYGGEGKTYLVYLPGEKTDLPKVELEMGLEEWLKFLHQTDVLEVEVWEKASDGKLAKAVHRKSQRQIDTRVQWNVFRRDAYRCRYCGKDDVPLTVDHLVPWEQGGPSVPENLVAACKNCNKTRGNADYDRWLASDDYKRRSVALSPSDKARNLAMLDVINHIPRMEHKRDR
jgi:hypothetical protein